MAYSRLLIRCVAIEKGHTTIALEPEFWEVFDEICRREGKTPSMMISEIEPSRTHGSRASAIRVFTLDYVRAQAGFGIATSTAVSQIAGATFFAAPQGYDKTVSDALRPSGVSPR